MSHSLRSKLSLTYAVMALLLVAAISFFVNFFFRIQFSDYVRSQMKQQSQNVVGLVEKQYDASAGKWNVGAVENIGMSALEQGMILKVKDSGGRTVWDATVHNNGMCVQMLQQMARNMKSQNPNFQGGYEETSFPVQSDFKQVGEADIGYYGPYYYTNNDIRFVNSINIIFAVIGALSLLLAFVLGSLMSRRISRPISKAVEAAAEISKGNFGGRITERSGTREIVQLTDTVNSMAESLQKQQDLRKTMAADVSHELRTPLASLQSSLEAMIDGVWEPGRERLESCREEILRINRLVGDLEKLERAEADNAVLSLSEFDFSEAVQGILHNFEPEFYQKGVALGFSGERGTVCADRDKISQVVVNLVSNALKYTPAGRQVEVKVKPTGKFMELAVRDTGYGIPPEDLPNIFERFYRADKSRNRDTGGSGLGLSITKAIVEAHKGTIRVKSQLDRGTEFRVLLPKGGKESGRA